MRTIFFCRFGMSPGLCGKLEGCSRNNKNGYPWWVVRKGGGERNKSKTSRTLNFESFTQQKGK